MCLIAWNWQPGSATPLLLVANRDEFYARAALPLHWWQPAANGAQILAGQDLQAGGTWLGLSRSGRMAALTNFRQGGALRDNAPSRGELVAAFLHGEQPAADFLHDLVPRCGDYNPFNLLVFDGQQLLGLESRHAKVVPKAPGLGAVSNADFQTPWPKLTQLTTRLQQHQQRSSATQPAPASLRDLLPLLHDRQQAPDALLPSTGVPLELERVLSSIFIATPRYGTRACSVLAIHQQGAEFVEQSFGPDGPLGEVHVAFPLQSPSQAP